MIPNPYQLDPREFAATPLEKRSRLVLTHLMTSEDLSNAFLNVQRELHQPNVKIERHMFLEALSEIYQRASLIRHTYGISNGRYIEKTVRLGPMAIRHDVRTMHESVAMVLETAPTGIPLIEGIRELYQTQYDILYKKSRDT